MAELTDSEIEAALLRGRTAAEGNRVLFPSTTIASMAAS